MAYCHKTRLAFLCSAMFLSLCACSAGKVTPQDNLKHPELPAVEKADPCADATRKAACRHANRDQPEVLTPSPAP